ncbi:hypothetical protein [Rhodovulum euryhalinum]|uniref:Uncharacterized protein n=1 Tax=Rhodovulum euryhalinum TaxID=35805 RepID=A0A4R2KK07_9RHOB|nr:hypothetical protein [Rhodovulum euryhalinum]TCO72777.1 hypothetical protein EV655_1034 [Rhodovulum euryhalinum]
MAWSIAPGQGCGPLRLGMTQGDVAALPDMGRPQHVYRGSGGRQMEYRGLALPICEYQDDALVRIVAGRHVEGLNLEGMDPFANDPVEFVRRLESNLGPVTLCQEQLCFHAAGLILGGFYEPHDRRFFQPEIEYHDERSVTLCRPGTCTGSCETGETLSFL